MQQETKEALQLRQLYQFFFDSFDSTTHFTINKYPSIVAS